MEKRFKIISFILFLATFIVFFPGKYWDRKFNDDCIDYCKDISTDLRKNLECKPPLDGFTVSCLGIKKELNCDKTNKCFSSCNNICFGLVFGTGAAPNPIEAKLNFVRGN